MINTYVLVAILVSMLVTWLPRIMPYFVVRFARLPEKVVTFLNYLPLTIIFALILSSLLTGERGELPQVKWIELVAVVPTFFVVVKSKNIMLSVVVGVVCVALLRLAF